MMRTVRHPIVVFVVAILVVIGAGIAVLVATGTSGLRTTATVTCVPEPSALVPVSARWDRVWTSSAVHLKRGMFVGLEVEDYWFQAVATGKMIVTVPLTEAWTQAANKSLVTRLQPLPVSVTAR
jgi:hypothetical protein